MSPENKIIGSVTVSAPFEREDRTYYATVIFDLHEDGQRSLRAQRIDDGRYIVHDQDFQEEAYALMHRWDTRELQIEVGQLKRENAALREHFDNLRQAAINVLPLADWALLEQSPVAVDQDIVDALRDAALSPQEAARG